MSRIGKQAISFSEKIKPVLAGTTLTVTGPLGELQRDFKPSIKIKIDQGQIVLTPEQLDIASRALWGTYASHIRNMIKGVSQGYEKKLILEGVGYKSAVKGSDLVLDVGFSHEVIEHIPQGLKVTAEKNIITITGIDKEAVGSFAARVRSRKVNEPYKGKGMRYADEIIRRKEGKKTTA